MRSVAAAVRPLTAAAQQRCFGCNRKSSQSCMPRFPGVANLQMSRQRRRGYVRIRPSAGPCQRSRRTRNGAPDPVLGSVTTFQEQDSLKVTQRRTRLLPLIGFWSPRLSGFSAANMLWRTCAWPPCSWLCLTAVLSTGAPARLRAGHCKAVCGARVGAACEQDGHTV